MLHNLAIVIVSILYATDYNARAIFSENVCLGRSEGYAFPDLNDCRKYTRCIKGKPDERECEDVKYKYFNEAAQTCVTGIEHCFKCPTVKFIEQPVKGFCNQYIRCIEGNPQYLSCSDGLLYDDDLDACNIAVLVMDKCDPCPNSDRNEHIFKVDPFHCDAYYVCISGQRFRVECATNLKFNAKTKQCDKPENVVCQDPKRNTTTTTTLNPYTNQMNVTIS